MTQHTLTPYTEEVGRRMNAHLARLGRVLSGEMEGKGRPMKSLTVSPKSPCATDGEKVWLSYPIVNGETSDIANLLHSEAVLAHECGGHLAWTNFSAWKRVTDAIKRGAEDALLHDFVNIVEDARVNYLLGKNFAGSKKRLDFAQEIMMQAHIEKVKSTVIDDSTRAKFGVLAIATEVIMNRGHFINDDKVIAMMNEARPLFGPALVAPETSDAIKGARTILAVYRKHFPEDETDGSEYGASSMPEAEGIFADDMTMESIEKAGNNQKKNKEKAARASKKEMEDIVESLPTGDSVGDGEDDGDGEGAGAGQPDEDGEGEGSEGEGEGEGEGSDGADGEGDGSGDGSGDGDTPTEDGNASDTPVDLRGEEDGSEQRPERGEDLILGGDGTEGSFDGVKDAHKNLFADAQDIMAEMAEMEFDDKGELIETRPTGAGGPWNDNGHVVIERDNPRWRDRATHQTKHAVQHYNATANQQKGTINKLTQSLKNLIKGADTRFSTHHKKGKLDTRRLWAHRSSDRVFTKPKVLPEFNLACVVLIDASGSMSGTRAQRAAEAAVTLAEVLEKVGAIYEVVDFNSSNGAIEHAGKEWTQGGTYMHMRKRVGDSIRSSTVKAQIASPYSGSQNSDGFAVKWAIERCDLLAMNTEGAQKLVFIISDGAPAGPAPQGMRAGEHLRRVLHDAEGGDTSLFSVGIDGMDTSKWYGNHGWATIEDADNLATDILVPLKICLKKAARKVVNG